MHNRDQVFLRLIEHKDAMTILSWESRAEIRRFTDSDEPITVNLIEAAIKEQRDVFESGQVRFIICKSESNVPIGLVDLYNIDFKMESAEVGIVIVEKGNRKKGYAQKALKKIHEYAENVLGVLCLRSFVEIDNSPSTALFESLNYKREESNILLLEKKMNVFKIQF